MILWNSPLKADVFIEASCQQECIGFIEDPLAVFMDCKRRCEQQKYRDKEIEQKNKLQDKQTELIEKQFRDQELLKDELERKQEEINQLEAQKRELETQEQLRLRRPIPADLI